MTQAQAAEKEATFFSTDPFFASDEVAAFRDRLGVTALRADLSKQLVALTQREVPKLKKAVDDTLEQVGHLAAAKGGWKRACVHKVGQGACAF